MSKVNSDAAWLLKERQALPLEIKIRMSLDRITEWYNYFSGKVYVSFSGGKDSTVLLHLVRSIFPEVEAVFVDTGLEYPEIRSFVKSVENVTWIKPKMKFSEVIERHGYPVISKNVSMGISRYRSTKSDVQKSLRLNGGFNPSSGKRQNPSIPKKHRYLIDAPFKISEYCCNVLKKSPFHKYEKLSGKVAISGVMACESELRKANTINNSCNGFNLKHPMSTPLSFWTEKDIYKYINSHRLKISKIYDMGEKRTGCMFCMFGVHLEKGENRFQRMKRTHPKQWDYCINKLGCGRVLDTIGVDYDSAAPLFEKQYE